MHDLYSPEVKKKSIRPPTNIPARIDPQEFQRAVRDHLLYTCVKDSTDITASDLYRAMAHSVRDRLVQRWLSTQRTYQERDVKCVYYLSSEFLTGRSLGLCLVNLGLFGVAEQMAAESKVDIEDVIEAEGDPGLGNGGLGRLAACFMDSLATLELPAVGYGIRYEYGIFEQRIENGNQVEHRDNWLHFGNPWELPRHDRSQTVRLYGRTELRRDQEGRLHAEWVDTRLVIGLPYDSFIVGHEVDTVNTLRLWSARASRDFDLQMFNNGDHRRAVEEKVEVESISKVLYPNDQTEDGRELRLKQQYFFVACSIADIVARFKRAGHTDFRLFPDRAALQLNDTHPSIAVAELMRVLVDQEYLEWDLAWDITQRAIGYTNHTLLPEALEKWPVPMFERLLPRHLQIIYEINQRFMRAVSTHFTNDSSRMERMSIIQEGPVQQVRMAHLATVGSHSVNGVARLHTDLVKSQLLRDFFEMFPERFNNKTNGVTPRRWLLYANPGLSQLLASKLGSDFIHNNLSSLTRLVEFVQDPEFLDALQRVKYENKLRLAHVFTRLTQINVDPESMFIAQIKRIHEYKRQLLAALELITHYLRLKDSPNPNMVPRTYVFGGKAAPGYAMAKLHIRLINDIAAVVNEDPVTKSLLKVVFVPNYGVSIAQSIIPAIDISLQISQAGKEASGTSNMKLALNGALTVGTLDGANVELREACGPENFFLFGLTVDEVEALYARGYRGADYIEQSPELARAVALIDSDFFCLGDSGRYAQIANTLRYHDHYMICADFAEYLTTMGAAAELFRSPRAFQRRAAYNIAGASRFSSDATIEGYAKEIWNLTPVKVELR
jgi:starch phosphorylase